MWNAIKKNEEVLDGMFRMTIVHFQLWGDQKCFWVTVKVFLYTRLMQPNMKIHREENFWSSRTRIPFRSRLKVGKPPFTFIFNSFQLLLLHALKYKISHTVTIKILFNFHIIWKSCLIKKIFIMLSMTIYNNVFDFHKRYIFSVFLLFFILHKHTYTHTKLFVME